MNAPVFLSPNAKKVEKLYVYSVNFYYFCKKIG